MPVTSTPIFPQTQNQGAMNKLLSTAMTNTKAFEGTDTLGTALVLVFTAGANGSRVDSIQAMYGSTTGATPSGTSTATTLRVFVNNGSDNTVATNNKLIGEINMPAVAFTNVIPMGVLLMAMPPGGINLQNGYKILIGMATAIGATNWAAAVSAMGGDY